MKSNKIVGILMLLVYVCIATALLNDSFIKPYNLQNLLRSSSMFAIIGIGAVFVIVTGGIDLSIGSVVGLVGCTMTLSIKSWLEYPPEQNGRFLFMLVGIEFILIAAGIVIWRVAKGRNPFAAGSGLIVISVVGIVLVLAGLLISLFPCGAWLTVAVAVLFSLLLSLHMGLVHGLLITKLNLPPFIVTLIALLFYRGLARNLADDRTQGLGTDYNDSLRLLAIGKPCTFTFVLLMTSIGLILFGLWKLIRTQNERRLFGLAMLVFGVALCFVSSSRYWDGWETIYEEPFTTIAGFDLSLFKLQISEEAIKRPAYLMGFAWIPMVLSMFALFGVTGFRLATDENKNKSLAGKVVSLLIPSFLVGIALVGLYSVKFWIGDETVTLSEKDSTTLAKMGIVFVLMAALMGGFMWLGRVLNRDANTLGRVCWLSVCFFAGLLLLSKTSIAETNVQTPFFVMAAVAVVAAVFLNMTVAGRYLQAMGNNEEAAKYSGVDTDRMKIMAYVICSFCAGIGAVLFTLDSNNVEPSGHGSFYELYAIAAAVLGGCSLRGGEGSILGVLIGASILRVLYNAPDMIGISPQLELSTMGIVILIGVATDEIIKRIAARKAIRQKRLEMNSPQ